MAQKDIEDIAEAMRKAEEEAYENDKLYERAQRELARLNAEEDAEYEDEIIRPEDIGMIDSSENPAESDEFYNEDEDDLYEEDVSDCLPAEQSNINEADDLASIVVDTYVEDGENNDFIQQVMKNVPGVIAQQKGGIRSNGDITVIVKGSVDDLRKAWAFYNGFKTFYELPQDLKQEFDTLLIFDDGDTLDEAKWRNDAAHCLDASCMPPSTANLASDKESIMTMVKEERARRSDANIKKALQEKDLSTLSDAELDKLQQMAESDDEDDKKKLMKN